MEVLAIIAFTLSAHVNVSGFVHRLERENIIFMPSFFLAVFSIGMLVSCINTATGGLLLW